MCIEQFLLLKYCKWKILTAFLFIFRRSSELRLQCMDFVLSFNLFYVFMTILSLFLPSVVKFFVIGHDCAHKSFSRNKLVEDIVGTLAFMPLIYPYEPWRFKHDKHHAKTNMLVDLFRHLFCYLSTSLVPFHLCTVLFVT